MKRNFTTNETLNGQEVRREALKRLGGKCSFEGCTWSHPDVLEIDHINPLSISGARDSNFHTYLTVLKMEHPENEFQLLCACHHRLKTVKDLEEIREYKSSLRQLDTQGV